MKKMPMFALAIASALIINPANLQADADDAAPVSITAPSDFYAPLGQYGIWVQVNDYGQCFRPTDAGVGWRPYCNGHWEWTDDGWYWDSDQPWAWACYHYGQWTYDSRYGWVWVPGTVWAPAWVSWRVGDHYIGWAPTPPQGRFGRRDADDDAFVFVPADRFDEPVNTSDIIVNKPEVIEHTRYVSNMKMVTKRVAGVGTTKICDNDGPGLETVEKASGKTFRPVPLRDVYARRPAATRYDSKLPRPDMGKHEETDRHEDQQHGSWPPANAPQGTQNRQRDFQRPYSAQPQVNGGQNSTTARPSPLPNYHPQATPEHPHTSPNEGSTQRRLEQLHSVQPHTTTRANPAGHAPERAMGHEKVIQQRQGNSVPANAEGQNGSGPNRNQGQ